MAGTLDKSIEGPVAVRILGVISLMFASGLFLLTFLNIRSWLLYAGPKWWPTLLLGACYWGVLGLGMVYYRKWAAFIFATSATVIGLSMIVGPLWMSIKTGNLWVLANVPFGVGFCLPTVATVISWRELR
jgi:hypothetical protein